MLLIATRNKHKIEEIKRFVPREIEVVSLDDLGVKLQAPEDGNSFVENSIKKAIFYGNITKQRTIADDSGLVIDALDGFPGVHSARFMEDYSYEQKMLFILEMLKNKQNRAARFVCAAAYYDPIEKIVLSCERDVKGKISDSIRGTGGFGYDPIFIPDGYETTFGEMIEEKHKLSHRYKAFSDLFEKLDDIIFFK
ncbi:RdgB/HAM1 family non-canonical purine NTP pyrophosphatase [Thermotoga profunda]|uniref:RdgB/HAM1 family non-canonical purine NTP pyrophosphatase n=1 Tax=Thermotoga profunda TaxID=1508420 RepID=UPI000596DF69|nr:RdgB/HAM1 family non-canonical purine NTP pyrophosphatase [Thermotoga profunda]